MGWLAAVAIGGGLAFWRRKTLREDADRARTAAKDALDKVRSRHSEPVLSEETELTEPRPGGITEDGAADDAPPPAPEET
jgi:hypothetical protein